MEKDIYQDGSYLEKNTNWHEEDSDWKYAQIKLMIDRSKIQFQSVVDVGCGAGRILELFHTENKNLLLSGFDITPCMNEFWAKRPKSIRFFNENFLDTDNYFDLLLLIDVFEHIENYYSFLKSISKKARYFIFHIPLDMFALASITNNYKEKKISVGHLHYFDYNTALGVLNDTGYKVLDYKLTKSYKQSNAPRNNKLKPLRKMGEFLLGEKLNSRILGGYSMITVCESL